MGRYIARRLAQGGAVIFGVTIFVFIITRVIGDPVKFMLPLSATEEDREERREALGLNDPLYEQFWRFLEGRRQWRLRREHLRARPRRSTS